MSEFVLYADSSWQSPWVFHVMVALEELGLRYRLDQVPLPIPPDVRAEMQRHAFLGTVPMLVDGDVWLTESLAISEYLAEKYPKPSIMPRDRVERARARQVMSMLRTSLRGLREDRPTESVFQAPTNKPLSDKGKKDAAELVRFADAVIPEGQQQLFSTWCIADADLSLMLMRLVANSDPVPQKLADYALAQWGRASVRKYVAYIPTTS